MIVILPFSLQRRAGVTRGRYRHEQCSYRVVGNRLLRARDGLLSLPHAWMAAMSILDILSMDLTPIFWVVGFFLIPSIIKFCLEE